MKNNYTLYVAVVVAFIAGYLFGQQNAAPTETPAEEAMEEQLEESHESESGDTVMKDNDNVKEDESMTMTDDGKIHLSGSAPAEGGVKLEWTLADGVEEPDKFMIVRGDNENPTNDGKHFWYRKHGTNRSTEWSDSSFEDASYHFRICLLDGDECTSYSNNLELTVKAPK